MRPAGIALTALLALGLATARADRIRLRGGGEIRGMIVAQPGSDGKVLVQTETGSKPMELDRDRIDSVYPEVDALDAYFARRDQVPATAEAQYQFGLWCEGQRLSGLAQEHFRRAAELDPTHATAQKKLGHVLQEGVWMTVAEQKRTQGLVLHRGRWISQEAFDRLELRESATAESAARVRELQVIRQALDGGDTRAREDADARLNEYVDPEAIPALVHVFGTEASPYRTRLVRLLGAIPGEAARNALIDRLLAEDDPAVRRAGLDELERRAEPETIPAVLHRLSPKNSLLSGRAARLLAELGAEDAVPSLVPLLVRVERRPVWVNTTTYVPPQGITVVTGESVPLLTEPVVGNGAVAYGATSVPYLSGVTMGSGGTLQSTPTLRMVTVTHRNADVLSALESLTGRSFGYDATAWRRWWTQSRGPEEPVKRVRQP